MKKLVLTIAIVLTSLSGFSNDKAEMNDDSYACRHKAYNIAMLSGYDYASVEWQYIYVLMYRTCEDPYYLK